jgi:hypothetical protein
MGRWAGLARRAADEVSSRAELWVPGALAWTVSVGWVAFVIGVGRVPTVAELTFAGARFYTSGAWPWNAVAAAAGVVALVALGVASFALAEAHLVGRQPPGRRTVGRGFVIGLVAVLPILAALFVATAAVAAVAPAEFNAPERGAGPIVRTALRVAPFGLLVLVTMVAAGAFHAAATRATRPGRSVFEAIRTAPQALRSAGQAVVAQVVTALVLRILMVAFAAILLRVLWAPLDQRLGGSGSDAAVLLLLVGFVAIWLCLVLAGGALHAWGSLTWTRVLGASGPADASGRHGMETRGRL